MPHMPSLLWLLLHEKLQKAARAASDAPDPLTREFIADLVAAGKTDLDDACAEAALDRFRYADAINYKPRRWDAVTDPMPADDLIAFLKALVVTERRLGWWGDRIDGSSSSSIAVYRELERRDPEQAHALADWILPRRKNPCVPFGNPYKGPPTYADYVADRQAQAAISEVYRKEARDREKLAAARHTTRHTLRREKGVVRAAASRAVAQARRENLLTFAGLSPAEQLRLVVADVGRKLDYYPFDSAWESDAVLDTLGTATREALLQRLADRRKGPWRRLHDRLKEREK